MGIRFLPTWTALSVRLRRPRAAPINEIARRLSNLPPEKFRVETSALPAAKPEIVRCKLHRVVPLYGNAGAADIVRFVEKRARRKEYRAYKQLKDCDKRKPGLAPSVYFAREYRGGATLLMEHLPQVGNLPAQTISNAFRLADTIFEVSLLSPIDNNRLHAASDISRPGVFDLFLTSVQRADVDAGESMRRRCEDLVRRFGGRKAVLTKVPCHNDLQWSNISSGTGERDVGDFRFLDWQLFGLNWIGADLHFLARSVLTGRVQMNFWRALLARYAERAGPMFKLDEATIELSAYCYALYRSLLRIEADAPLSMRWTERLLEESERLIDLR